MRARNVQATTKLRKVRNMTLFNVSMGCSDPFPSLTQLQKAIEEWLSQIVWSDTASIYEQCLLAMALMDTANEGDEVEGEQWEGWLRGFEGIASWGAVLPGSHLLVKVGYAQSIVISVQMLLGLGERKRGNRTIADFIQMSSQEARLGLRLQQLLRAMSEDANFREAQELVEGRIRPWAEVRRRIQFLRSRKVCLRLFAIASQVCYFQRRRVNAKRDTLPEPLGFGKCWEGAFGQMPIIDLSQGFLSMSFLDRREFNRPLPNILDLPRIVTALLVPEGRFGRRRGRQDGLRFKTPQENFDERVMGMVDCELSELMATIGAKQFGIIDRRVIARGLSSTIIRLGVTTSKIPYWHVLITEEVDSLHTNREDFVKILARYNGTWKLKIDDTNHTLDDGLIRVGCLVGPEECNVVLYESNFVPGVAGGKRTREGVKLKAAQTWTLGTWRKFKSVLSSLEDGLQIESANPGTDTKLSGKLVNNAKTVAKPELSVDYVISNQITAFKNAMVILVFVYESVDGQVSE
jgi:hypothetical protein